MHCRGEKTRRKKPGGFRKKIKIPESEISENEEQKLKSKIGIQMFVDEKYLKNILLPFMKLILIFMSIMKKK